MPHLTSKVSSGRPLVDIYVGVSEARQKALEIAGKPVPPLQGIRALIDTGASHTCLDSQIIRRLGLTPTGKVTSHTASSGATPYMSDQYDVSINFPLGSLMRRFPGLPVIQLELSVQGIDALIGFDLLRNGILILDGPADSFIVGF